MLTIDSSTCEQTTNITFFTKHLKHPWKTISISSQNYVKRPNTIGHSMQKINGDGNVNLVFLTSLSDLKEWSLFGFAKGANIDTMTMAALFTEVKAYDATLKPSKTTMETTPCDQA